jgi:hypothetical protein
MRPTWRRSTIEGAVGVLPNRPGCLVEDDQPRPQLLPTLLPLNTRPPQLFGRCDERRLELADIEALTGRYLHRTARYKDPQVAQTIGDK